MEMCDQWDHTLQNGNDTEYTFFVLALCVGILYSFVRFLFRPAFRSLATELFGAGTPTVLAGVLINLFSIVRIPISPPHLPLRI
jgi:hypothetical protein